MHAHTLNDQQIMAKLAQNPQQGLSLLMEQYTGLIWHIAAKHLHDPEDIKECVNETFARFYFQRDKYDPGKASPPLYLSAITRNLAISRYRKEQCRQSALSRAATCSGAGTSAGEAAGRKGLSRPEDRQISLTELRADVEKAMEVLPPEEASLIRMKYYGGMTTKEIAASLGLPYETVKKRHHRSLKKLRHSMLISLILLALLPDFCSIYQEDLLLADTVSASTRHTGPDYQWTCLVFSGVDLPRQDSSVELSLTSTLSQESLAQIPCELGIPFTLTPAPAQETGNLLYELRDDYCILAVPRRENGSLVVSLCPFSADGVPAILSSLVWGSYGSGKDGDITLTGERG